MSKRFVIQKENLIKEESSLQIIGDDVNHIFALRHDVGDKIQINEYDVIIKSITKKCIDTQIIGNAKKYGEPAKNITLIQGYLKSDKMEWVVQKAVELGAKKVIAVQMQNSVVKIEEKDISKKEQRLQKIAKEAIQQCGRTDDVNVSVLNDISQIALDNFENIFICHEKSTKPLKEVLYEVSGNNIAIVVGPEGGLGDRDILKFTTANSYIVSLGERILRAETASIYMLSIMDFLL